MKKDLKRFILFFLTINFINSLYALGLGDIKSLSMLNQPLNAEIEILDLDGTSSEAELIHFNIASHDEFERVGLTKPQFLNHIRLSWYKKNNKNYIKMTTKSPIKETYLNFLVKLEWPNGSMLKEYTLLLDPPNYTANLTSNSPIQSSVTKFKKENNTAEIVRQNPTQALNKPQTSNLKPNNKSKPKAVTQKRQPEPFRPSLAEEELNRQNKLFEFLDKQEADKDYTDFIDRLNGLNEKAENTEEQAKEQSKSKSKSKSETDITKKDKTIQLPTPVLESAIVSYQDAYTSPFDITKDEFYDASSGDNLLGNDESQDISLPTWYREEGKSRTSNFGKTRDGDTLWTIAKQTRPESNIPLEVMMKSIFDANPQAFINGDMNRLKANQTLQIPAAKQVHEINRQAATNWYENSKAKQLADAQLSGSSADISEKTESIGISDLAAENVQEPVQENKDRLRIITPGAGSDTTLTSYAKDKIDSQVQISNKLKDELLLANEALDTAKRENETLKAELEQLKEQFDALSSLVKLKQAEIIDLRNEINGVKSQVSKEPEQPVANVEQQPLPQSVNEVQQPIEIITQQNEMDLNKALTQRHNERREELRNKPAVNKNIDDQTNKQDVKGNVTSDSGKFIEKKHQNQQSLYYIIGGGIAFILLVWLIIYKYWLKRDELPQEELDDDYDLESSMIFEDDHKQQAQAKEEPPVLKDIFEDEHKNTEKMDKSEHPEESIDAEEISENLSEHVLELDSDNNLDEADTNTEVNEIEFDLSLDDDFNLEQDSQSKQTENNKTSENQENNNDDNDNEFVLDFDISEPVANNDTGADKPKEISSEQEEEVATKLDLAKAYIDMGDPDGAKEILEEVLVEGNSNQIAQAKALLNDIT